MTVHIFPFDSSDTPATLDTFIPEYPLDPQDGRLKRAEGYNKAWQTLKDRIDAVVLSLNDALSEQIASFLAADVSNKIPFGLYIATDAVSTSVMLKSLEHIDMSSISDAHLASVVLIPDLEALDPDVLALFIYKAYKRNLSIKILAVSKTGRFEHNTRTRSMLQVKTFAGKNKDQVFGAVLRELTPLESDIILTGKALHILRELFDRSGGEVQAILSGIQLGLLEFFCRDVTCCVLEGCVQDIPTLNSALRSYVPAATVRKWKTGQFDGYEDVARILQSDQAYTLIKDLRKALRTRQEQLYEAFELLIELMTIFQLRYDRTSLLITMLDKELSKELKQVQDRLLNATDDEQEQIDILDTPLDALDILQSADHPLQNILSISLRNVPGRLHPAAPARIISALTDPYTYTALDEHEDPGQLQIPDICILWRGYCESGKLINLADWFNYFETIVGKGSDIELQARFVRAVHELDHLGFLKAQTRRREHVLRTIFVQHDEEEI